MNPEDQDTASREIDLNLEKWETVLKENTMQNIEGVLSELIK